MKTYSRMCVIMYIILAILVSTGAQIWAVPNNLGNEENHPNLPTVPLSSLKINPAEFSSNYWKENAQQTVLDRVSIPLNQNKAKNVIIFLGDGMSIPTVSAARVYNGGEETQLSFDKFPYVALSKTYAVDRQTPDSASTATAYLSGVKANYGTIGIGPEILRDDCLGQANTSYHTHSIAYYSQLQDKRTGLVSGARVTHASPGGVYAHTAERNWESDTDVLSMGADPTICTDIATQILVGDTGKNLNVVMGGGRSKFLPNAVTDEEGVKRDRTDGINLISAWLAQKGNGQYIWNRDQLLSLEDVDNVLGLFAWDHMDYNLDRNATMQPSLAEMTTAAIKILSRGENGYFLFVEGHHAAEARVFLNETIEFSKAVQAAVDLTDEEDTLIVVTADHVHTMSYGGYSERGHDILEFAGKAADNKVYTTVNYANGPGFHAPEADGSRYDLSQDNLESAHYTFSSLVPLDSETHGGDDVAIYARGPWAHLFSGVLEQNVIPHLMSFASCVGEGHTACDK